MAIIQTSHLDIALKRVFMQTFEGQKFSDQGHTKDAPIVLRRHFCNNIADIIMEMNKYISLRCLIVILTIKDTFGIL